MTDTTNIHIREADLTPKRTHLEKLEEERSKIKFSKRKTRLEARKPLDRKAIICGEQGLDLQQVSPLRSWDTRGNGMMFFKVQKKSSIHGAIIIRGQYPSRMRGS